MIWAGLVWSGPARSGVLPPFELNPFVASLLLLLWERYKYRSLNHIARLRTHDISSKPWA
jgi:hypothetical protein